MFTKKINKMMALTLSACLTLGLAACAKPTNAEGLDVADESGIVYSITPEAGDAAEVEMLNTPTAPHWFPAELMEWDPETDEDMDFNRSVVPLATRASKDSLEAVNSTQNKDFKVAALSIMNASTSGNPSQGSNKFNANTFSYWQYIDTLVYWAGSAGEGIIVPPSADVIDSAHKNGVPVLGTIFFPMVVHGGKAEWVDDFLQKDVDGNFPMIDKLITVCDEIGFDGWFINEETGLTGGEGEDIYEESAKITKEHAQLFQEFMLAFKAEAGDRLEIMWYDSLTNEGDMAWQNALTDKNQYFLIDGNGDKVADSMFLNFWWTNDGLAEKELLKSSNKMANEVGLNPYDLYAGIDLQANGVATDIRWDLLVDENNLPYTSLGLYCPSWTYFSSEGNLDQFQDKESRLWVNEFGNPAKDTETTDTEFKGMSTYAIEKTAVTKLPFNTNFNMGNGYNFFINGEKVSALDWNNRSLADIMPTYRWIVDNEGSNSLKASIDYADAYYGGNSIKLAGDLGANQATTIKLFSADLELDKSSKFITSAKSSSEVDLDLILEFHDGTVEELKADSKIDDKWTNIEYDISKLSGKAIKTISYKVSSDEDVANLAFNLGGIKITGPEEVKQVDVTEVNVDNADFEEDNMYAGARLSFEGTDNDSLSHYEIYMINEDDSRSFLGATPNNKYFVNALERGEKVDVTTFEVVAVNIDGVRGEASTAKMEWPDNSIPTANFRVSRTLAAPGEEIQFESLSSRVTESVEWKFEGATVESSTEESPIVTYDNEGVYTVTLTAKSEAGEDVMVMEDIITITNDVTGNFENLSHGKKAEASSFVNAAEAPEFAFDGELDTKWCAVGTPPHNIVVDLGQVATISEVRIAHAEAGGESPDMNTSDYTIEVSEDGKLFTEVVSIRKNSAGNTVDTFKAVEAQFVRIIANKPTQGADSAVRLYEIEVFGIK